MDSYKTFLSLEAVNTLRSVNSPLQFSLASFIDSLASSPFQQGDYSEEDNRQRQIEIKLIGEYSISYWTDHAACEVKVTDISLADNA